MEIPVMKRRLSKYILLSLVILIAITVVIGFYVWNQPHENIKDAIAVKTNAIDLYQSLANDSSRAKLIFVNKVVAVTGKVKRVFENQKKQQVIFLQTNVNDGSVNCTLEQKLENINEGDTLTLKGICIGYSGEDVDMQLPGDVFLIRCYRS